MSWIVLDPGGWSKCQPKIDPDNVSGEYALMPGAPGFDAGVIIPNLNDNYAGNGPDMGAFEADSPPMEFGIHAYPQITQKKKRKDPQITQINADY